MEFGFLFVQGIQIKQTIRSHPFGDVVVQPFFVTQVMHHSYLHRRVTIVRLDKVQRTILHLRLVNRFVRSSFVQEMSFAAEARQCEVLSHGFRLRPLSFRVFGLVCEQEDLP